MNKESIDMLALTVAVEEAARALREVISQLKATYYHYDIADWDTDRWTDVCEKLETAIADADSQRSAHAKTDTKN
jgi:hypothetical protein